MGTRTVAVFLVGILTSALMTEQSKAAEVEDIQALVEAVSQENLSSLAESNELDWPKVNLLHSIDPIVGDASEASKASQSYAAKFLELLRDYEDSIDKEPPSQDGAPFRVYSLLGERLEKAGGSLNLCLLDSLNRCAMARLCHSVLSGSLELESAQRILESLHVPKCDKSFLVDLMSTKLNRNQTEGLLSDLPVTRFRQALLSIEGYPKDFSSAMVQIRPTLKTSALLSQANLSPLVIRLTESWRLHTALLPGLLDFLSKGGKTDDLADYCRDFPKFMELMGPSYRNYRFEPEGQAYIRPSDLLGLVDEFGDDFQKSRYYWQAVE
jgi:hypothetical protein